MRLPRAAEVRVVSEGGLASVLFLVEGHARSSEPGKSRYHLTLPASLLPARAIVLESRDPTLFRSAVVNEIRFVRGEARPTELGRAVLRKVERGGATAADLRIPIDAPEGPELELVIDDGDNLPFRLERAFVELPPLPWIYFETDSLEPLVARWGDPTASAPRYDLEAKRDAMAISRIPQAEWSNLRPARIEHAVPPFPGFKGAGVDRESFRWMKPVPDSPAGLTSLLVDAEAIAHSNDLADLRIVTEDGRQVPYLIERRDEPIEVPVELGPRTSEPDGRSRYALELPWPTLPRGTRLMLRTSDRVFDRGLSVVASEPAREPRVLSAAQWTHADPERLPRPLVLDPPLHGHARVALLVDEGDNAPLEIKEAALLVPSIRLRFIRDDSSRLSLMYGASSLSPPRYDIDMLAARLFGSRSHEIEPGEERALKEIPSHAEQTRWFWLVVALSAVALLVVIARVLRAA